MNTAFDKAFSFFGMMQPRRKICFFDMRLLIRPQVNLPENTPAEIMLLLILSLLVLDIKRCVIQTITNPYNGLLTYFTRQASASNLATRINM